MNLHALVNKDSNKIQHFLDVIFHSFPAKGEHFQNVVKT